MEGAILLVDRDLGHAFWLGRALDHVGFQTFPARTLTDAAALLRELHLNVDLIMVDCALSGAENFIGILHLSRKPFKVFCLNGDPRHVCVHGTDAVCPKPLEFGERAETKWARDVRETLLCAPALQSKVR